MKLLAVNSLPLDSQLLGKVLEPKYNESDYKQVINIEIPTIMGPIQYTGLVYKENGCDIYVPFKNKFSKSEISSISAESVEVSKWVVAFEDEEYKLFPKGEVKFIYNKDGQVSIAQTSLLGYDDKGNRCFTGAGSVKRYKDGQLENEYTGTWGTDDKGNKCLIGAGTVIEYKNGQVSIEQTGTWSYDDKGNRCITGAGSYKKYKDGQLEKEVAGTCGYDGKGNCCLNRRDEKIRKRKQTE